MWHPDMPEEYKNAIVTGDALELIKDVPDESVHLVYVDPPYNIGKAEWDKVDNYFEWCRKWIVECSRVLKSNGAFWISHSRPLALAKLSGLVTEHGRGLVNWITWDKYNNAGALQGFMDGFTLTGTMRSWQPMAEYLIYHADEGEWTSQCDKGRGFIFEPLQEYLDNERMKAGVRKEDINEALGFRRAGGMAGRHYFSKSQWQLPTKEHYYEMRNCLNSKNNGRYLEREFEDLRSEFENLRYIFNNPGKMSSIWQIPPAKANFHATPKPEELMRRVIKATSNEGNIILDPMCGSGTTALASRQLGRNYIAFEIDPDTAELARERVRNTQPPLPGLICEQLELPK